MFHILTFFFPASHKTHYLGEKKCYLSGNLSGAAEGISGPSLWCLVASSAFAQTRVRLYLYVCGKRVEAGGEVRLTVSSGTSPQTVTPPQ